MTKCPEYIWIVIPVYNHAETLKKVVEGALKFTPNVLVVNDASTDADIKELLADTAAEIINHKKNRGKGAALQTAGKFVKKQNGTYIITLDADGQHDPDDIVKFLPHIYPDSKTIIVGSRDFDSENIPDKSKFGRKFSNFWIKLETGQHIHDSQSGFRGYPVASLSDIKCISHHYAFETEILVRSIWAGMSIININISVFYPKKNLRISHFKPFMDNFRISLLHSRLCVESIFHSKKR